MKKAKTKKLLHVFTLLLLSGLLYCCNDERERFELTDADKLNTVTFSVKVPGASTPKTYALAEGDENEVSSLAILLFDGSGNYTYQPIYSNTISTDPSDSKIKTFTVDVPEGTYNVMVLANANTSLTAALSSINTGDSKASVVEKLLLSNSGKWNAVPGSAGYVPIPMWGEITGLAVSSNMAANIPVTLIRMVSKIDLSLGTDAKGKFNLQSVRLYNYNDKGQIAPTATNWSSATHTATAPSVPTSAQKPTTPADSPLLFDGTAITKDPTDRGISCTDEIYTFEAPAGSSSALSSNTCLVVGGVYDGDTQATYYRIDLANTTGAGASATTAYLALLRNHRYKINITDVKSSGFPTHKDAFNSRPINITATVVEWNEALITHIAYNGQYLLGVSKDEFTFTREERTATSDDNILSVTTDYPGGWSVQKIIDDGGNDVNSATNPAGWLELSSTTGVSGATTATRLILAENSTTQTRTAYIHLAAGRLSYIVKVQQGVNVKLALSITDADGNPIDILDFPFTLRDVTDGTAPDAQRFNLNWSPASSDLLFGTMANSSFVFASGADYIPANGTLTSGSKSYTIQAPVISQAQINAEPFYERSSIYLYSVSDGMTTINKTLTLRQHIYNVIPVVDSYYWMDGTQKSFGVLCNSPFEVELKNNLNSVITLRTTSGNANTSATGTPVYFDIIDDVTNPTLFLKNEVVTIKSPTNLFPPTDVTLNCISAITQSKSNSYIVAPGGDAILIPVSRANDSPLVGSQLYEATFFTADLVWTDNSNKVAANSNIQKISAVGTGKDGYLFVKPGSASGNAVVAIKNGSGKILWSWHIWVTNFTPSPIGTGKFMDRNLGAIGNTPGQAATLGLLYQWGRKDPFPGSASVSTGSAQTIYNTSGTTSIAKAVTVANNIYNAVANPLTFYYYTKEPYDWYTISITGGNSDLWGPTRKTVYDPCPGGWRVPQVATVWNGLDTNNFGWSDSGRTNSDYGGFYPAAGNYGYSDGAFNSVGANGYYWSATNPTTSQTSIYHLFFSDAIVTPSKSTSLYRSNGFSVRCVKE